MSKLIGIVDCNNFFASCERVFRPDLDNKPVMVLSANDGCIIARSNEVKELGIQMGSPLFKVLDIVEKHKINIFSTNFALYGSLSIKVMKILNEYTSNLEIYSIDEAFMDLSQVEGKNVEGYLSKIIKRVKKEVGIPISIGVSQTKTLAKIACKFAKKDITLNGVKYIPQNELDSYLRIFDIKDIWGIGRAYLKTLNNMGIKNAYDLKISDNILMRKKYGVSLQRTILELNGTSCIPITQFALNKKNILRSRSFGQKITNLDELESAISSFIRIGGNDLRRQHLFAWQVSVFIRTDIFNHSEDQYRNFVTISLSHATSDQISLNKAALQGLKRIFKHGYYYKKAGILLSGISPCSSSQLSIGEDPKISDKNKPLNIAIDRLNYKYGRPLLRLATEKQYPKWFSKSRLRSSNFLSSWDDLPVVNAI